MLSKQEVEWLKAQNIAEIIAVEQLTQAITNDVYLISNGVKTQFIFKRLNRVARSDDDRQAEYLVQVLAHKYALTPQVLAHSENYKLQQYVQGKSISAQCHNLVEILVTQLHRIHQLPVLHAPKQRLVMELNHFKKQLTCTVDEIRFKSMLYLALQLDSNSRNDTLCHGDLSVHNVLLGKNQRYYILDWEYAVIACPAYDLAFCICNNTLSEAQSGKLISDYYSYLAQPPSNCLQSLQKECQLYLILFKYINELWSLCFVDKG